MKHLLIVLIAVVAVAQAMPSDHMEARFALWMKRHGKVYVADELAHRFTVWKNNLAFIEQHNLSAEKEGRTYQVALNHLADMTNEEYRKTLLGLQNSDAAKSVGKRPIRSGTPLPTSWDWRTKGAVLPVQNQGQCGSCWAFTTMDAVSGMWFRATTLLLELSVQEVIDCSGPQGNAGCNGGLPSQAYAWIIANKGVCLWSDYPYNAETGNNCLASNCTNVATITGVTNIPQGDEVSLQNAVYGTPVSSAINAGLSSFQFYAGGVYNDPACNNDLDHGMTNIGWGVDPSAGPYWILRNMWGVNWGMSGYVLMARGKDMCGLADAASFPTFHN